MKLQKQQIELLERTFTLSFVPTPFHPLKNLSKKYPEYRLFIKRDDQTGLATGGNKSRKLEYFIFDALENKCDAVITCGAQQSNHCRQTAAACAVAGLECHLVLGGVEPEVYEGNLLLSHLLGANFYFTGDNRKGEDIPEIQQDLQKKNKKCYPIPYGGSSVTGAFGYVKALKELKDQLSRRNIDIDYIFFASSSGGTMAGLILGMELLNFQTSLMPVNIDKEKINGKSQEENISEIINEGARLLNMRVHYDSAGIKLIREFDSPGYAVVTENETSAIRELAGSEGILLDPVYTGRAFHGMLHYLKNKMIDPGSNILFWHTGGLVTNNLFAKDLNKQS